MSPGREPDLERALRPVPHYERAVRGISQMLSHAGIRHALVGALMKLLAGRAQDLADVEAIIASGTDRELLRAAVQRTIPDRADTLERLFGNVDRER